MFNFRRIEPLIHPLRDLFGAVFFVSVGMSIDPAILLRYWREGALLTAVVISGKVMGVSLGALLTGHSLRASVQASMTLAQIGEVLGESGEPGLTQAAAVAIDEKARADLHHDATELVQRRRLHGEKIRRVAIAPPASWRKARHCKARERGGGGTVGAFARQLH